MPRKKLKTPNPVIPSINNLETSTRNYILNNQNTLRGAERVLRQSPEVRRELDSLGGLNRILTRPGDQSLERDYLSRFSNVQTTLFVDRLTQGDLLRTPSLETMFEQTRENNRVRTAVASALDSCCSEVIGRLKDLETLILQKFRSLRDFLISNFSEINTDLENLDKSIIENAKLSQEVILEAFIARINRVIELITESDAFIREKIETSTNDLKSLIRSSTLSLENKLDTKITELLTKFNYIPDIPSGC